MEDYLKGKRLLIIGGIATECDIVRYAKAKGIYTIVADYDINSPAKKIADKGILVNALDVDALEKVCREEKVDGVITGFADILLIPYMEVCKRLGLPCYITEKMLSMSTNKIDFKETCEKYSVPVPKTYFVGNNVDEVVNQRINYPVFVKPLDSSGSRGASVCYDSVELRKNFKRAIKYSPSGNAIVEEYITGREFLLDYVGVGGEFRLLSIFDRYVASDRGSAINYSTMAIAPSRSVDFYLDNINEKVINMFKNLGFQDGLMFMQGYYEDGKVTFFEMGCRLGGSYFAHEQDCIGDNSIDMVIRFALTGHMVQNISLISETASKYTKYAVDCNYLLKGENETVTRIVGLEEVSNLPGVIEILKYHDVGFHYDKEKIVDIPIFTVELNANTKEELIERINFINNTVDVFNEKNESILMSKLNPEELFR